MFPAVGMPMFKGILLNLNKYEKDAACKKKYARDSGYADLYAELHALGLCAIGDLLLTLDEVCADREDHGAEERCDH